MHQWHRFTAVFFKEFKEFFSTKFSWFFLTSFVFITGSLTFYAQDILTKNLADSRSFFLYISYLYIVFIPILTMNIWQKERAQKSLELLLSLGARNIVLVLAKFSFLVVITFLMLISSLPIFFSFLYLGNIEVQVALSGYLGAFLLGIAYVSVGQFSSFIMKNQAGAFILSLSLMLLFSAPSLEKIRYLFVESSAHISSLKILEFSFSENYLNLIKGNLSLSSLIFFISASGIFLAINTLALNWDRFKF